MTTTAVTAVATSQGSSGQIRMRVRAFLRAALADGRFTPAVDCWTTGWDEEFSRLLGANGFLGLTIPTDYGGQGRTYLERFAVTEELLAVGAPVAAHWIADRQVAPALLQHGSAEQKRKYLPRIASGECYFAIGMSEPEAGSDLAAVRTKAHRVEGGWVLNGSKVWTSGAHHAEAFFVLARTESVQTAGRHGGLSQFIVDLRRPGVEVRPIYSSSGEHHFNEVFLTDVFVADTDVVGNIGEGWSQVTRELSFERSGPERFLSTFPLFAATLAAIPDIDADRYDIGRYTARYCALHQMSQQVSTLLQAGVPAGTAAAQVKVLGGAFEGDVVGWVDAFAHRTGRPSLTGSTIAMLDRALAQRPGFTLRGGTSEILRDIIAGGVTKAGTAGVVVRVDVDDDLTAMINQVMTDASRRLAADRSNAGLTRKIWAEMTELGLTRLTGDTAAGGSGAAWPEAAELLRAAAGADIVLPFVENDLLAGWLTDRLGLPAEDGITTIAMCGPDGHARNVLWTDLSDRIAVIRTIGDGHAELAFADTATTLGSAPASSELLGRDITFDTATLEFTTLQGDLVDELRLRGALARSVQMVGAIGWVVDSAVAHVTERKQFGRALAQFQAVRTLLADITADAALAAAAVTAAVGMATDGDISTHPARAAAVAVAKSGAGHASEVVIRHGHQLHGAIGTTLEHDLHRYTNALLAWRNQYGNADYWDGRLAHYAISGDPQDLWARLTLGA